VRFDAPPFKVEVVDTTAAGDAFTGALGVGWDESAIGETLRFANAVGALATTKAGAQPSLPLAGDVARMLERLV
jgi:ribokinase